MPPSLIEELPRPQSLAVKKPSKEVYFSGPDVTFIKWSLMSMAVLWMIIYRLSEAAAKLPEFVYVNF